MLKDGMHRFNVNLEKDLYDKLQALSKKDKRSVSNYITVILEKHVEDTMNDTGARNE